MSAFEGGCWMWYLGHVTPTTIRAGLVAKFWPTLADDIAELFLMAFNRINGMFAGIEAERRQDRMGK